jgi:hypothetical protein
MFSFQDLAQVPTTHRQFVSLLLIFILFVIHWLMISYCIQIIRIPVVPSLLLKRYSVFNSIYFRAFIDNLQHNIQKSAQYFNTQILI